MILIVLVYVDDLIYTSNSVTTMHEFKQAMNYRFKMKDLDNPQLALIVVEWFTFLQKDHRNAREQLVSTPLY